jgi:hypothetical protein
LLASRADRDGRRSTTRGLIENLEGEFRNIFGKRRDQSPAPSCRCPPKKYSSPVFEPQWPSGQPLSGRDFIPSHNALRSTMTALVQTVSSFSNAKNVETLKTLAMLGGGVLIVSLLATSVV